MEVFEDPRRFQQACLAARARGELGFVPTMGYLHAGHEELMRRAARHAASALTIFVNPTQFGPSEDFARYPRDTEGDLEKARRAGIGLVLLPAVDAVYPPGFQTYVEPGSIAAPLEGGRRPGHFRGVATVVLKLFALAQPTHAYFGRKDFQQLALVRRMTRDFDLPIEVVGVPTVREPDGLAMSSRNSYLSPPDRLRARCLSQGLRAARRAFAAGERDPAAIEKVALEKVAAGADTVDYVSVRDAETLQTPVGCEPGRTVALIAAGIGRTRLIDNDMLDGETSLPEP